jgi:hypothetical protein
LLKPDISDESIVITALFHDLGKIGLPGKPYYLPNDNKWEIEKRGINYKINPEIVTMNIAVRSLYLVSKHIPLTEMEAQAIVAHDGIYPVRGGVNNLDYHHNECRLQINGRPLWKRREDDSLTSRKINTGGKKCGFSHPMDFIASCRNLDMTI